MLSKDIFVGSIYLVKISGKIQQVKILKSCTNGGWIAVNLATVMDFLKQHKQAIIRVKGYCVVLTYRYRKVRITEIQATHPVFDEGTFS